MPEVKADLLKRGYILVGIGEGVTGNIQLNDTYIHSPLKKKYRELDHELMITQLSSNPSRIPQPSCNNIMRMLVESNDSINVDIPAHYKALWITNKLNGSENHLGSECIMNLAGQKLMLFRKYFTQKPSPKNLNDLLKLITPPKGGKRGKNATEKWCIH